MERASGCTQVFFGSMAGLFSSAGRGHPAPLTSLTLAREAPCVVLTPLYTTEVRSWFTEPPRGLVFYFSTYFLFFLWPYPQSGELPKPGTEPMPQLQPVPQLRQHQIPNPLRHKETCKLFTFLDCTCSIRRFPGQGLNPHHSTCPSRCRDGVGSLTCCATGELLRRLLFPLARDAVTKDHRLLAYRTEGYSLTVLEAESPRWSGWQVLCPLRPLSLARRCCLFALTRALPSVCVHVVPPCPLTRTPVWDEGPT